MKRRVFSLILSLALVLSLGVLLLAERPMAAENVYFTSVNDTLCPLGDDTMPFWSGGNLYVHSAVFSSYDLGLSYVRDTSAQTAILYNSRKILEFDLSKGGANNKLGTYYSASAVSRGGGVYFPLAFVSSYFGLSYSVLDTSWAPLVRLRSTGAVLSDSQFIDAASTLMSSRYNAYEQSKNPPPKPEEPGDKNEPELPLPPEEEENDNKNHARVLLAIRAEDGENVSAMLNTLGRYGYKATFFFEPGELAGQDDLLRRIVASGHRLGLVQPQSGGADALEKGNEQLRRYTGTVTRLALAADGESARAAGYAVYTPTLSAENLGTGGTSRANRMMNQIEKSRGTVRVLLGGDAVSASALNSLTSKLYKDAYTVRPVNEVACV